MDMEFRMVLLKVFAVFLVFMSAGLISSVLGPTLLDFKSLFNTTYEGISIALALRGLGIIPGSIFSGRILEKHPDFVYVSIMLAHLVCIVLLLVAPFVVYVQLFWIAWTLIGAALGIIYVAGLNFAMNVWEQRAKVCLQITIFGNAIGAMLTPVIANPFLQVTNELLEKTQNNQSEISNNCTTSLLAGDYGTSDYSVRSLLNKTLATSDTKVQYAFVTMGIVSFLTWLPCAFISLYEFCRPQNISQSKYAHFENSEEVDDSAYLRGIPKLCFSVTSMISVSCVFINFFVTSAFIRTFSVDHFSADRDTASFINTCFLIGNCLSPLICILVLLCLSTKHTFLLYATTHLLFVSFWIFLSSSSLILHLIGSFLISLTVTASINLFLNFYKEQVNSAGIFVALTVCIRGLSDFVFVWLTGWLYDSYGSDVVYAVVGPTAAVLFISAVVAYGISTSCFKECSTLSNIGS